MPFTGPTPRLEHIADMRVDIARPLSGGVTPMGMRNWFGFTGGSLTSTSGQAPLVAKVLPGGGDYSIFHQEAGVIRLDINMVAVDSNNDLFKFRNTGFIKLDDYTTPLVLGTPGSKSTEFGESEVVESITIETASKEWGWLNFATLIGQVKMVAEDGMFAAFEIRVFKITMK
ncbi:hypothetical protein BP6252_03972 [Coleophoma cylindrospora]|uniref:Uncharacterized protein n=1 Tax=Coleophoma cylindrospora TaxID=1849047 RepID=A0A3D8S9E4_9HELO|nr:hypothetical protein BP6252_03972 [Coleophoma cylindrospora]